MAFKYLSFVDMANDSQLFLRWAHHLSTRSQRKRRWASWSLQKVAKPLALKAGLGW